MSKPSPHPFTRFAQGVARRSGHPMAFGLALGLLISWMIFGPLLNYHPVWLDFFGIATGMFTFLMVFLIQNTQNRDTEALHLKIDELLRVTKGARKDLISAEDLEEDELDRIKSRYDEIAENSRNVEEAKAQRSP